MKKWMSMLLCALLLAAAPAAMAQSAELDGTIEAAYTVSITAPYSGTVGDFTVKAGDALEAGDALFAISTQKIYAGQSGTVVGLFAEAGDRAETVQARYGALCYLEDDVQYKINATSAGADSDIEDKVVHAGETVYLKSTQNSNREGAGRVTAVSETGYTVEITDMGKINLNESVKIYRDSDHDADSCIGSGKTSAVAATAVNAAGSVLRVCVSDGQKVKRGDLLFEVVPDELEGLEGGSSTVTMPEGGVLLSVNAQSGAQTAQDAVLATYCPADGMKLICLADEDDLAGLKTGARVSVTLEAYPEETLDGEIEKIAAAANEDDEFEVTIALKGAESLRIGMSATVTF